MKSNTHTREGCPKKQTLRLMDGENQGWWWWNAEQLRGGGHPPEAGRACPAPVHGRRVGVPSGFSVSGGSVKAMHDGMLPEGGPFERSKGSRPRIGSRLSRYLIIVARGQLSLYDYLTRNFAEDPKVQVLLDRRKGERRQKVQPREPERRKGERRRRPGIEQDLRSRSVVIIRVEE